MSSWSKDFLLEFIELFRQEECLWKLTSKEYHNKQKREASYKTLIDKVKEVDPLANKLVVTKKINTLRCSFRKELRKAEKSAMSGMSADDVYHPKLWYYDQLMFLSDQETSMETTSSLAANSDHEVSDVDDVANTPGNTPATTNTSDDQSVRSQTPLSRPSSSASSSTRNGPVQFKRQKKLEDQVLASIGEKISDMKREDRFDVFGRNVAVKLRSLPEEHRIYAEKKINDALFEAEIAAFQHQATVPGVNAAEPNYRQHRPQYHNMTAHFSGQSHATNKQPQTNNASVQFVASSNVSDLTNYYSQYSPNEQLQ